jgi:hypothetical protein
MSASGFVHLNVQKITGETEKAFFFRIDGKEVCIPKSQVADPDEYEVGDEDCEVSVTEWIAKEKGLLP